MTRDFGPLGKFVFRVVHAKDADQDAPSAEGEDPGEWDPFIDGLEGGGKGGSLPGTTGLAGGEAASGPGTAGLEGGGGGSSLP